MVKFSDATGEEAYEFEVDLDGLGTFWMQERPWSELRKAREAHAALLAEFGLPPGATITEASVALTADPGRQQDFLDRVRMQDAERLCALIVRWDSDREVTPENVAALPSATKRLLARAQDRRVSEDPVAAFS